MGLHACDGAAGYPLVDRQMNTPIMEAHTPTGVLVAEASTEMSAAADVPAQPNASACSLLQQLQMYGDHIPLLQSIMLRELQAITPTSQQLQLAQIIQQQRSTAAPQTPQRAAQPSNRVEVVPLVGLCLTHFMADQQQKQRNARTNRSTNAGEVAPAGDAGTPAAAADLAPADLLVAMKHCSPFVNALHSELRSLHKVSSSCYTQIMQQLAAVGRHLPPTAGDSNRRSSSSGSNNVPPPPYDDGRASNTATEPHCAGSADRNGSSSGSSYHGRDLNLQLLQQQTDNAALDLIHLEDCVSNIVTRLTSLAQQYDIMITAALAAAAEHAGAASDVRPALSAPQQQQVAPAGDAPARTAGARKGHGFLGPLLDAVRGHKGSKDAGQQQQRPEAIEYVFMQPGVCSHSNPAQVHSYIAGVPADVYSTSVNKLLRHMDCSERVIWMLSVIYARLRYATEAAQSAAAAGCEGAAGAAAGAKQWSAPDKFTRSTTKYWVHPSNVLRLKLALTKQLPLLVYGADDPVSSGDIAAAAEAAAASTQGSSEPHKVTSLVSSVYFDGPDLPVYHTRLARLDGAKLARIRYYGQRQLGEAGGSQAVFVEQKTHRDKAMGETSFKERGSLKQSQLPSFLSRSVPVDQLMGDKCKKIEHLAQVQDFLTQEQQVPILRTEYLRSAWQAYDDNAVRFSLDENMLLLREAPQAAAGSSSGGWCRPLESLPEIPCTDAVRFPYAILEVKLQDKNAAPSWVHELTTSGVLVEAPRFSKFLHGMALLHPTSIREVPAWFAWREGERINLPASLDEMWDMTAERRAQTEMDWQDNMEFLRSQDPTAGALTPDVDAMLVLLKAPRTYMADAAATAAAVSAAAGTAAAVLSPAVSMSALSAASVAASKLLLPAGPSYELTASAAAGPVAATQPAEPQEPPIAAPGCGERLYVNSYPCEIHTDVHTSSSANSHSSGSTDPHTHALRGPAHGIMQDGQFGYAGNVPTSRGRGRNGVTEYRGAGGSMHPLLGLTALPGGPGSFSCTRTPGGYLAESPTSEEADGAGVQGNSPAFGSNQLTVRLHPPHRRSLSSDSMGSSLLHASHSSSSCMGPTAAEAAMPHMAIYSSSPSCHSASPSHRQYPDSAQPGYPRIHLSHEYGSAGREQQYAGAPAGSAAERHSMRPGSHGSSSGGTCDSWRLSTVNPLYAPSGPALSRGSATPPVAAQRAQGRDVSWGALAHTLATAKGTHANPTDQSRGFMGLREGNDVVVDFGKLAGQGNAPLLPAGLSMTQVAAAAGAGRPQVVQVHYTGAVEAVVPVNPSPRQVRELSQLLPPTGPVNGSAAPAVALAAVAGDTAAGEGSGMRDQLGVDGVAADSAQGSKGVKGKGSKGYKQRVQQWKAAVSSRVKGMRGGKASRTASGSFTTAGSMNEHMLGFGGTAPRQPSYVKARADPKTFFANERTFLQWLQISVLVMMTGLGMLTGSSIAVSGGGACMDNLICSAARISGAIIAPVSILFMVYALYLYQKRTKQLLQRSTLRYDDTRGPWMLTILLILVTLVVIVLALESYRFSMGRG